MREELGIIYENATRTIAELDTLDSILNHVVSCLDLANNALTTAMKQLPPNPELATGAGLIQGLLIKLTGKEDHAEGNSVVIGPDQP